MNNPNQRTIERRVRFREDSGYEMMTSRGEWVDVSRADNDERLVWLALLHTTLLSTNAERARTESGILFRLTIVAQTICEVA